MSIVKVGINGFGRIGKMILRLSLPRNDVKIVGINDPFIDANQMAYLLKFDSVHGRFDGSVDVCDGDLIVNGNRISVFSQRYPSNVKWNSCGAKYIAETSGFFTANDDVKLHIKYGGARKVVVASAGENLPIFIPGINLEKYEKKYKAVSMASAEMNCIAPLIKILSENFGIEEAMSTTINSATSFNSAVDSTNKFDLRKNRSILGNIIPVKTNINKEIESVFPDLKGRLITKEIIVPTSDVGLLDFSVKLKTDTCIDEVRYRIKEASETYMKSILGYTEEEIVSSDIISDKRCCIFDAKASVAVNGSYMKLFAWFDNEVAYSDKVLDLIVHMNNLDRRINKK